MKSERTIWQASCGGSRRKINEEKQTKKIKKLIEQNPEWSRLRVKEIIMLESVKKQINRMRDY